WRSRSSLPAARSKLTQRVFMEELQEIAASAAPTRSPIKQRVFLRLHQGSTLQPGPADRLKLKQRFFGPRPESVKADFALPQTDSSLNNGSSLRVCSGSV